MGPLAITHQQTPPYPPPRDTGIPVASLKTSKQKRDRLSARFENPLQKESIMSRMSSEAVEHSEGGLAKPIEELTARLPSDTFLWLATGSIIGSLGLMLSGRRHDALFVGQWAPTFLLLGVYNKIVKVAGSDRIS
jgi:hypothetical protein